MIVLRFHLVFLEVQHAAGKRETLTGIVDFQLPNTMEHNVDIPSCYEIRGSITEIIKPAVKRYPVPVKFT
jgi:hypothetical protein